MENAAESLASACRRVVSFFGRHGPGLVASSLGVVLATALITDGTFRLTTSKEHGYSEYYDALGKSMLQGRFDVPPVLIGLEAFRIDGRTYGYFGPTPAVLRLPLNAMFPTLRGRWTRLSMVTACGLTLLATYLLLQQARRTLLRGDAGDRPSLCGHLVDCLFVVGALVGTPMLFLMREAHVYHEASMWGVALALWAYLSIIAYCERARFGWLLSGIVCAVASYQARSSVGLGPLLSVALLIVSMVVQSTRTAQDRPSQLAWHTLAAVCITGLSMSAVMYKNIAVFGNLSGVPPLSRHVMIMNDPQRLAQTDGGHFIQLGNLRTTLTNYFHPSQFHFGAPFPFFRPLGRNEIRRFPETRLDWGASFASFTAINPIWIVLAAIGLVFALRPDLIGGERSMRGYWIVLTGAAAGAGTILVVACIAQRYLHDVFPLYVIASTLGLQGLALLYPRSVLVRVCVLILALVAVYTCYANISVSMTMPRIDGT